MRTRFNGVLQDNPPSGAAGGDLAGTYPSPTVANGAITAAKVAAANIDGLVAIASMRTLGTGAQQAAAGTAPAAAQAAAIAAAAADATTKANAAQAAAIAASIPTALLTTRGQIIRRGAAAAEALAAEGVNTFLGGDGTDLSTRTAAQARLSIEAAAQSWAVGGPVVDYVADPNYAPAGLSADSGTAVSDMLGDGTVTPRFYAVERGGLTACARNANGLRITNAAAANNLTAGNRSWPYNAGQGGAVWIPLRGWGSEVEIDATIAFNLEALGRNTVVGDWIDATLALIHWIDDGGLPTRLSAVNLISDVNVNAGALTEYVRHWAPVASDGTQAVGAGDVSGAPWTVANITTQRVVFRRRGHVIEILTADNLGALAQRAYRADVRLLGSRADMALVLSTGQYRTGLAVPYTGLWAELRSLTITPL